jgi:lysozyme family protein
VGLLPLVAPGDGLADIVLDIAVMSGATKAIKAVQAALGVAVDGVLGPRTMAALSASDRRQVTCNVIAWDLEFQGRIITDNPQRAQYAAGWATRLAGHVRRLA